MLMSSEGADAKPLAASLEPRNAADWSPDARWIVTGGRDDEQGEGLFMVPVDGGAPVRLATGPAANPVWSPDGTLIVFAGPQVGATSQLLAVRPEDGSSVALPHLRVPSVRQQAHRFLPNGTGLVYTPTPGDFRVLDLSSKKTRQVARLTREDSRTFDITPDGKRIVFDRLRQNSDIALIELPPR
jgi:Tol biopolymer transport system component